MSFFHQVISESKQGKGNEHGNLHGNLSSVGWMSRRSPVVMTSQSEKAVKIMRIEIYIKIRVCGGEE